MNCPSGPAVLTPDETFDLSMRELLGVEGDFSNHPADPGGKTRFGITEAVARRHGYSGPMTRLPVSLARRIYRKSYWKPVDGDVLAEHSPELAFEVFEFGVNAGVRRGYRSLQEVLNAANRGERDWRDLEPDGWPGPASRSVLRALVRKRGSAGLRMLEKGVDARQFDHYFTLAQRNPAKYENFFFGWAARRIGTNIT